MKKKSLPILIMMTALALTGWHIAANASDLLEVYQQALVSDPVFQQAIAQRLSTKTGVPISLAAILPSLSLSANPTVSRIGYSGSSYLVNVGIGDIFPRNVTQRTYSLNLTLTQTVFNAAEFATIAQQVSLSKGADATLNASLQNLMIRVSTAYFNVLKDEDNLSYSEASKLAFSEQLDQMQQQYKVGLKTVTDVYTAQASYDSALANYIQAQTTLTNDRENLRVITGIYYEHLSTLSEEFPLVSPQPADVEQWVKISLLQNWSIKSYQYGVDAARRVIYQQFAGNLPTANVQVQSIRQYSDSINDYRSFDDMNGPGTQSDRQVTLNLNLPILAGGGVVANTYQAKYNYEVAQQQLEQTIRGTINTTRQSYNSIISGISQIKADKEAIKSTISSLNGLEASYRVGTETLVDVLNQQQNVYKAQTQYATDRYAFVTNILTLKQAAGTLSYDDLRAVNAWLIERTYAPMRDTSLMRKKHHHK